MHFQLLTLEIFSNRVYKDLNDHIAWGDMLDSDIIVCYELPIPSRQSRPNNKRQDGEPFIVPVFMCDTLRATRQYGTQGSSGAFGYPFFVAVDEKDACDKDALYSLVLSRLERWTENARDLSRWEMGSPTDSLEDSLEEVPIPINGPADSTVEINENGDVIQIEEIPPEEEGDIVDQKETMIREADEEPVEVKLGPPRKVGFKKDIFQLHLHPHATPYGVGFASFGPSKSGVIPWDVREEEVKDNTPPVLLNNHDALICEFDSHIKSYYFGEHARWDKWDAFIHPEFKAGREAAKAAKKKSISLQDCLDEFTKEEKLGEDDLWYCPRCKKHQQATKRFDIWSVPDILVVHLKRFSNNRSLRDKIDAFVDFPIEGLDLTGMVGERQAAKRLLSQGADIQSLGFNDTDEPLVYDLYGVDEHLGGLGGGHYRAYAHNHFTDQWYHFDDSYVTLSQPQAAVVSSEVFYRDCCTYSNLQNANAYLLFYKRRTTRPLGGKSHEKIEAAKLHPKNQASTSERTEETQLPTPPSEPLRPVALPGPFEDPMSEAEIDVTPPDTRSSSASRGSTPPPLDEDLPSFEDSALDPLILSTHRYDLPDPAPSPSLPSPSSSVGAEADSDEPDSTRPQRGRRLPSSDEPSSRPQRRRRWPSQSPREQEEDGPFEFDTPDDDEMN